MEITKVDANQIEVVETKSEVSTNLFTYEYLLSQKEAIQDQKDRDNAQRDKELAEVNFLIAEADKLGVIAKVEPVEETPTEPVVEGKI